MTSIARTNDPTRMTALVAGVLYLITYASSIPAALLLSSTLTNPDYILGAGDGQIRLAALLDIINGLTAFGTAVALYSVIKRYHGGFAIGFVASRLFEAAILFIGVVSVLSIATLRETAAASADPTSLRAVGQGLTTMYRVAFVLGTGVPALNAFLLGWVMYRTRLVPRAIPVLGLIGAVLFTAWLIGYVLGVTTPGTPWHGISVAPIFFWELFIGLWMTFKGFNRSAVASLGYDASSADADDSAVPSHTSVASKGRSA